MPNELRKYLVNWNVFGAVEIQAESEEAARRMVCRTSLGTLLDTGYPDYELDVCDVTDDPSFDHGSPERELRGTTPDGNPATEDSLAKLIGEHEYLT